MEETTANWELIQQKTFTRWVNSHLKKRNIHIENLLKDLEDGVALCNLYEIISDESLGKYTKEPKNQFQKIVNQDLVLKKINNFVKDVGIKVQYSAKQVMDGERRPILGMIWCLIHKFQIQDISESELSAKEGLLLWCQKQTKDQRYKDKGVDIKNFSSSWRDGLAFCALIHKHRPDLIPFDILDSIDSLGNLNLAFDVAERELDIPRLLDAEDLVNESPDEKSIMTYLTNYWKKFSASDKVQKVAKKIGKLAQKHKEIEEMKHEFEKKAFDLNYLIVEYEKDLSDTSFEHFGNSLEKALQRKAEYNTIKHDLPVIAEQRATIELLLSSIRSKQKNPPRFGQPYSPPEELSPEHLKERSENLNKIQEQYDLALREHIIQMKRLEVLYTRFVNAAEQISKWEKSKLTALSDDINHVSRNSNKAELNARLKVYETTFLSEIMAVERSLNAIRELSNEIIEGKYEKSNQVEEIIQTLETQLGDVKQAGKVYSKVINDNILKLDKIVDSSLTLAKNLEILQMFLEETRTTLSEPISLVKTLKDVKTYRDSLNEIDKEYKNKQLLLEQARQIQNSLDSEDLYNPEEHLYSKHTITDIEQQMVEARKHIDERNLLLDKETKKIEDIDKLMKDFEDHAEFYRHFIEEKKEQLTETASKSAKAGSDLDSMKENFEEMRKLANEILEQNRSYYNNFRGIMKKIEELDVSENTKTTQNEISSNYHTLEQFVEKIFENAQQQIFLAEQATRNRENIFSTEEMNDFRETFMHFDKDRDGKLVKLEFRACAAALGEDVEDSDLDEVFSHFSSENLMSFDKFLEFMKGVALKQEGESKEDILNAFQNLCTNKNSGVTEQELRSVLSDDQVDYLISAMEKNEDGTYNYKKFLAETFGDNPQTESTSSHNQ
jgi:actinin alpha